ncbi:type II toxin-antitoxin system HipA family toxin [Flammeovirga pacifica]|uniref:Phosphatidylinositol kinase n=1 Tax=Flammeovirga pacifica TaxID=915059 RepID=A0A1S1Z0K4_FLAPC|nr:type II toxin-antitoxin system HipA family toxin [Flammeovirga pacifica]OHX66713.1 phosphatidylinositol kinase [Flammeovirga pacifica]
MRNIKKIRVNLNFSPTQKYQVGEIINNNQSYYFKYSSSFLSKKLELSPFKLPLKRDVYDMSSFPFEGIAGVFNDSLPDGWGRLLLDRKLTTQGIDIHTITPLERLAYVGESGAGALTYEPEFENGNEYQSIELDKLADHATQVLEGSSEDILDELFGMGGSSGGARPKINVLFNPQTTQLTASVTPKANDEFWIIKFPSSYDVKDIAHIEYAYYLMATACGIEMSTSQLFYGATGKAYFGTKRFDRLDNQKRLHMHTASGIMHDNFRLSNMDYGHLLDCAFQLEKSIEAYENIFRLACFNVFTHNRDDHSKNFSFLMDSNGNWKFSPAYDLTYSSSSHGFHSTTIAGESQSPNTKHLMELANHFGIKNGREIIDQVKSTVSNWKDFADNANVTNSSKQMISNAIEKLVSK